MLWSKRKQTDWNRMRPNKGFGKVSVRQCRWRRCLLFHLLAVVFNLISCLDDFVRPAVQLVRDDLLKVLQGRKQSDKCHRAAKALYSIAPTSLSAVLGLEEVSAYFAPAQHSRGRWMQFTCNIPSMSSWTSSVWFIWRMASPTRNTISRPCKGTRESCGSVAPPPSQSTKFLIEEKQRNANKGSFCWVVRADKHSG